MKKIRTVLVFLLLLSAVQINYAQIQQYWKVVCKKGVGEIYLSNSHSSQLADYFIMKDYFLTYNEAYFWVESNCPRWRCDLNGACAIGPVYGGKWRAMCHQNTKLISITDAHPASYPEYITLQQGLLSYDDARLWVNQNYPSWSCESYGNTRTEAECIEIYCPGCSRSVTLLGQSTTPQCQSCIDNNRTRINECMRGNSGGGATGPNLARNPNFTNFNQSGNGWGTGAMSNFGIWWNSGGAKSTANTVNLQFNDPMQQQGISTALYISNPSSLKAQVYGTTAQRINVQPNTTYIITVWAAARNLNSNGGACIITDASWNQRPIAITKGNYGWTQFSGTFTTGNVSFIDLRILSQDIGEVWLTGLTLQRR
jgi:hypothetical protein